MTVLATFYHLWFYLLLARILLVPLKTMNYLHYLQASGLKDPPALLYGFTPKSVLNWNPPLSLPSEGQYRSDNSRGPWHSAELCVVADAGQRGARCLENALCPQEGLWDWVDAAELVGSPSADFRSLIAQGQVFHLFYMNSEAERA